MIVLHGTLVKDEFVLWAEIAPAALPGSAGVSPASPEVPCVASEISGNQIAAPARNSPTGGEGIQPGRNSRYAASGSASSASTSTFGSTSTPAVASRSAAAVLPPALPVVLEFAATYSVLRETLSQSCVDLSLTRRQCAQTTVYLPALHSRALASSALIGLSAEELTQEELMQVRVEPRILPAFRLSPPQLIELLCHCLDQEQLGTGLVIGQDLQYFALAMRFAGNIVSKQQFLPGLRIGPEGGEAFWEPVFPGDDGDRLVRLSRGMPLVCLAGDVIERLDDIESGARSLLVRFLGKVVDYLVRKSYDGQSVLLPGQNKYESAASKQLHARWLTALVGKDPVLEASTAELAALSSQIAEWRRPVEIASDSPFRLCFRLEEPSEEEARLESLGLWPIVEGASDPRVAADGTDDRLTRRTPAGGTPAAPVDQPSDKQVRGLASAQIEQTLSGIETETVDDRAEPTGAVADPVGENTDENTYSTSSRGTNAERPQVRRSGWYLRFLLQSIKEPSMVLPVETVLSPAFEELQLLRGGTVSAREYLFRSLGQAVRLCPEISESFNQKKPLGVHLNTNEAYEFLAQKSPMLQNAGFSVQLPGWWTNQRQKLSLSINIRDGHRMVSLDQLAEFSWEAALGDEPVSEAEIEKLTQLRLPLVCMNGNWTELNPEHLSGILSFLRKRKSNLASGRDLVRMALGDVRVPEVASFGGITGGGVICEVVDKLHGQIDFETIVPSPSFEGALRPYQLRGLSWLEFLRRTGFGACLADDMGLGKTVQTLAFIQRTWQNEPAESRCPTLLVCPTSLLGNWLREVEKFTPGLEVILHHGTERSRGAAFVSAANKSALVLTTYNLLQRDQEDLRKVQWETVILDEAQNIKNPNALQTQAAFALRSRFRIALSGTPVENCVADLWSLMHFLNPGFLGRQSDFHERFFVPIQVFQDHEKTRQLRKLTAPFILRRLKTDKNIVSDLPEKRERKVTCTLTKEQASLYAAVLSDATADIDQASGMRRKSLVLTTLLRLKQICDHPALIVPDRQRISNRSGKLRMLTEMLSGIISAGERALVFTQFTDMGEIIQQHLQTTFGTEVLYLHGGTERSRRERMVERFQQDDSGPPVFVLSLKAGGTGLNLTRAAHVFHFDRWWNPAVEDQATDRAYRMGQHHDVQVHKFVCAGTLEERIDEIIEVKKHLAQSTIGAGEGWLTEMSTDQLREVLSLRNTALVD